MLVAEDDRFYSNIYKTKLSKEGYEVEVANNGDQALKIAKEKTPDLILLDLIMPNKDGFELLKELREDNNLKKVKIIILSNLGQEEDIKRVRVYGVVDYLVKTNISIHTVIDKIKEHLV
ncbi:hypothetical protein A3A48_04260 [Candidatus Curtissbacteria bacterium RIFCSPLOWO2_01_FULL_37_9]|uniref:Response regulatory domain-containing protein n=1 Tax=Candidatus Curtissbacteria bacterium RIFCSPLOWO2_01_FULL_37_9 TaxID=1797724 RepID=A0A1F5GTE2_9BACT|nr:MAG: hypothetical protein A3A48_04260 [Candidatus Curtissbacteria bacterium RIFCSPLOWO2_01_FULL_37_9]